MKDAALTLLVFFGVGYSVMLITGILAIGVGIAIKNITEPQ